MAGQIHIGAFPAIQPVEYRFEDFDPVPMITDPVM
jgi:hypothetical protein